MRPFFKLKPDEHTDGAERMCSWSGRLNRISAALDGGVRPSVVALLVACSIVLPAMYAAAQEVRITPGEDVGMSSERLGRIVPAMRRLIDAGKIPGTVTVVARHGKIVHFEAVGSRNIEAGQRMTKDTIFRLYSQTKPITGVAVLILLEEGRFLLSDPISKYLPEFQKMRVFTGIQNGQTQTEEARPITIYDLLTHTSGLTYSFRTPVGKMYKDAGLFGGTASAQFNNIREWSEALAQIPLVAQPGTEWNYGASMDVLGRLVKVISGQTYRSFLKERIFDPLRMPDTDFYVPEDKLDRFAACYKATDEGLVVSDDPSDSPYRTPPKVEMGGHGLVGTAADYLRFAWMLVNGGELDGVRILGTKTVELMMMDHRKPEFPPDPLSSLTNRHGDRRREWGVSFGMTGSVVSNPALTGLPVSKGVFGWGGAATTEFWVDRKEDLVGMVYTQLKPSSEYRIRQRMQLLTYQAIVD